MAVVPTAPRDSWATRTRYIAELVGADGVVVTIGNGGSGYSTYASHNVASGSVDDLESVAIARATRDKAVSVAAVSARLADARVASDLCIAPLVWQGNVVGSVSALRVGRPWEPAEQRVLARSADLVALELAETHARLWWQRSAEAWQRRIQMLEELRRELSVDADVPSIVDGAAQRVAKMFGASGASLMLLDREGQLIVRSAFGPHERVARSMRRQIGEGISGWVAQRGEALLLRGRVQDDRFTGVDPTIEEALVVPLRSRGRVVGVVATRAHRRPDPYGDERLRDLDLVANELAATIVRYEESAARVDITSRLENDRREAVAMYDLARLAGIGADPEGDLDGATRLIADAFGHDTVAIWTVDAANERLIRRTAHGYGEVLPGDLRLHGDDLVGTVIREQRARIVHDPSSGGWRSLRASSFILAPIVVGGEGAGLLVLGKHDGRYARFEFELATTMADILSSLVRREIAARLAERSAVERQQIIDRMQHEFADEMSRVVYVLDACQRLLGQDKNLPADLARAARDARSTLGRLGIPLAALDERALLDPTPVAGALTDGEPRAQAGDAAE